MSAAKHSRKHPSQLPIFSSIALVAIILGVVPAFFLFYGALGSAAFGLAILGGLISIQFLVFFPSWRSLQSRRQAEVTSQEAADKDCL